MAYELRSFSDAVLLLTRTWYQFSR